MAAGDTNLTMIGNLVSDPELRFTPSGAADHGSSVDELAAAVAGAL